MTFIRALQEYYGEEICGHLPSAETVAGLKAMIEEKN
jgi:hypothetical protein